MSVQPVSTINSMLNQYIEAGFVLVPIFEGKGPTTQGWNQLSNCVTDINQINPNIGYGLAHAYSGTCALDIDDMISARTLLLSHGINIDELFSAPDSVAIDSGNAGHAKLLFRLPFGITLPSKKVNHDGKTSFELRCATTTGLTVQDVLPSALYHPTTGRSYRWTGNGHFSAIPVLPITLLTLWQSLIDDNQPKSSSPSITTNTLEEITSALDCVPADCSRDEWLDIGMGLHHYGYTNKCNDEMFDLWNNWSATAATKYKGIKDLNTCWRSFKARDDGITIASLYHIASEYGYKRPSVDVSQLFADVTPARAVSIIDGLKIPLPVMPIDCFPSVLSTRAKELSYQIGCDPLVPLMAGLGAVCAAVDSRIRLELMPGYQVPPILWLMTIGAPADKKTPASKPLMSILGQLEREDTPRYKDALMKWEAQEAMYAHSKKAYLDAAKAPEMLLSGSDVNFTDLPSVANEPPVKPVPLRLTVGDITSQKLVHHCADRPQGVLCYLDEMNSWVHKLSDSKSGENRSCWTEGYEGKRYMMDRIGTGSIIADPMSVSIYGNIQPRVLRANIQSLSIDGLIQRFIPVVLSGEYDAVPNYVPPMLTNVDQWEQLIRLTVTLPAITYKLSEDAYVIFREWQHWYQQGKHDERLLQAEDNFMTAYGKAEGTMARLMLVMHIIENPYSVEVSAQTCANAIKVTKNYILPILRHTYTNITSTVEKSLDEWIIDYIIRIAGDVDTINTSEVKRAARRQLEGIPNTAHDMLIKDSMYTLETEGWLVMMSETRRLTTWAINPAIKTNDYEYRKKVTLAKQRQMDNSRAIVLGTGQYTPRKFVKGWLPEYEDEL